MKLSHAKRPQGFTLLETVIAIGVLSVLLTGFIVVFTPAAQGIRKSINVQEADRLASALEQELVTQRPGNGYATGFDKAFNWIRTSDKAASAVLVYQYRGELGATTRPDGTLKPVPTIKDKLPGKDYVVVPMARSLGDTSPAAKGDFKDDLGALEGGVYLVKCTQLIFAGGATPGLVLGSAGAIKDPKGVVSSTFTTSDTYPEAVIAFAAEFHTLPAKTESFFNGKGFTDAFAKAKNPVFTRNLAVRR